MKIKIVKNSNPGLAIAKKFGGGFGLVPIDCFWVEGTTYHPVSERGFVYKNSIVIDETTELWYGKGLCGEGLKSLEETINGLPPQTMGAWVGRRGDDEPVYVEDCEALMRESGCDPFKVNRKVPSLNSEPTLKELGIDRKISSKAQGKK